MLALLDRNRGNECRDFFFSLPERYGASVSTNTIEIALRSCLSMPIEQRHGVVEKVLQLALRRKTTLPPKLTPILLTVLQLRIQSSDVQAHWQSIVFMLRRFGLEPNADIFACLMCHALQMRDYPSALSTYELSVQYGTSLNTALCNQVMRALYISGNHVGMLTTWTHMASAGLSLTCATIILGARALFALAGPLPVQMLVILLMHHHMDLTMPVWETVVDLLHRDGRQCPALVECLLLMAARGVKPSPYILQRIDGDPQSIVSGGPTAAKTADTTGMHPDPLTHAYTLESWRSGLKIPTALLRPAATARVTSHTSFTSFPDVVRCVCV